MANLHLIAAFAVLSVGTVHVCLLTLGRGSRHPVRPRVTGFDEVEPAPEQAACPDRNGARRVKG